MKISILKNHKKGTQSPNFHFLYSKPHLHSTFHIPNSKRGQALIEILSGVAIVSVLILGAVLVLVTVLKSSKLNREMQTAQDLASGLLDSVRAAGTASWQNLYGLSPKGSSAYYHVTTTPSGPLVTSSAEIISVDSVPYTRYFYLQNICRGVDSGGIEGVGDVLSVSDTSSCPSGSMEDPSTQKVTVTVTWPNSSTGYSLSELVARFGNTYVEQTSWGGGPAGDVVASTTSATTTFSSYSNIDYSSSTGAIQLQNP